MHSYMNLSAIRRTGLFVKDIEIYLFEQTDQILKKMKDMINEDIYRLEIGVEETERDGESTFDTKMTRMSLFLYCRILIKKGQN